MPRQRSIRPRSAAKRLILGLGGSLLVAVAVVVLVAPHGTHRARGLFFLLAIGVGMLVLAVSP